MASARWPLADHLRGHMRVRRKGRPLPRQPRRPAIANPVTEGSLTSMTLTPDAVKRLGIETATTAIETVSRTRSVGGEIIAPPGGAVTVTAPAAGTLQAAGGGTPRPGTRVHARPADLRALRHSAAGPQSRCRICAGRGDRRSRADAGDAACAAARAAAGRRSGERTSGGRSARATEGRRSQRRGGARARQAKSAAVPTAPAAD